MGAERKSQYIDQEAKLATAYHEVRVDEGNLHHITDFGANREDMPLLLYILMELCHYTK